MSHRSRFIYSCCPHGTDRIELISSSVQNLYNTGESLALDAGCGEGRLCELMFNGGFYVIGIDLDIESLRKCWNRLNKCMHHKKGIQLVHADVQYLPFKVNSFNVIVCCDVIEHLTTPNLLIRDIANCLKRNGMFLLSTPNAAGIWTLLFDRFINTIRSFSHLRKPNVDSFDYRTDHISLFTWTCLKETLQRFGFSVEKDIERWRVEGLLIALPIQHACLNHFGVDLEKCFIFRILKKIELKISQLLPMDLQSGWIILCKNTR